MAQHSNAVVYIASVYVITLASFLAMRVRIALEIRRARKAVDSLHE